MAIPQIVELIDFCLNTTYFIFDGAYYQQTYCAAMRSPISPLVANYYMEQFEKLATSTAPHPPSLWLRYVDDTFTVLHEYDVEEFTEHISSIDPHIKFTIVPEKYSKLPFLDLCIHILDDGSTKITIYRKPTHTDQYLNFKSHHLLTRKRSVVRILTNRAQQYVTTVASSPTGHSSMLPQLHPHQQGTAVCYHSCILTNRAQQYVTTVASSPTGHSSMSPQLHPHQQGTAVCYHS